MRQPQGRRLRTAGHRIKGSSGYSSLGVATVGCMLFRSRRAKKSDNRCRTRTAAIGCRSVAADGSGRPDFAVRAGKGSRTRAIRRRARRGSVPGLKKQDGWWRSEQSVKRRPVTGVASDLMAYNLRYSRRRRTTSAPRVAYALEVGFLCGAGSTRSKGKIGARTPRQR